MTIPVNAGNSPESGIGLTDNFAGTEDERRERASAPILAALNKAKRDFEAWQANCDLIDDIYSRDGEMYQGLMTLYGGEAAWRDNELDLFWSSFEVMKPAVYARPPKPAVKPMFSGADRVKNTTAELLERASTSAFARTGINDVMCHTRDDVLFAGRGVIWLRYETDDGQRVCVEHLDRKDFLHEPARKWADVGWVAGGFWLDRDEMTARFKGLPEGTLDGAKYTGRRGDEVSEESHALSRKCQVWEVWHKADNKTYWVTEGVDVLLDVSAPQLKLSGFFPCPRPAYATLKRRSLVPVPDWNRYAIHFRKVSDLTGRIYCLLDTVRMKGLVPGGGDIGEAVEQLLASNDDQIVVPVPGAALMANDMSKAVVWLPLDMVATAITGLITARSQLIDDFYQLSGISDIMRGATEAEETLGAQQLKSQYGSVRVREKIDELQRVAADAVKIASEIIAEKFTSKNLLDMAQMELPTRKDIKDRIREIEGAAKAEMKALGEKAKEAAAQTQDADPQQAQAMLQQAQQEVLGKYAAMLAEAEQLVPIEDVVDLLRDDKARSFAFEVESDSTILTDEMQEKASRGEFLTAFNTASQGLMGLATQGEEGATLAGEMLKFALAPFRAGRQLDGAIDAYIQAAPSMAAAAQSAEGESEGLVEANKKLAEAEMVKAQAALAGVEAKAALDKAEMQRKLMEMQQKALADQQKAAEAMEKLRQSAEDSAAKLEKTLAEVDHLRAETAKILHSIGLDERKQELGEYQAAEQTRQNEVNTALTVQDRQSDQEFRGREADRADRGEERANRSEDRAARQQDFAERKPQ
jgi:hypothetical protein